MTSYELRRVLSLLWHAHKYSTRKAVKKSIRQVALKLANEFGDTQEVLVKLSGVYFYRSGDGQRRTGAVFPNSEEWPTEMWVDLLVLKPTEEAIK